MNIIIKNASTGEVIYQTGDMELEEYLEAIEVLSKPRVFGNSEFILEECKYRVIHSTPIEGVVFASDYLTLIGANICFGLLNSGFGHGSFVIEDMTTGEIVNGCGFERGEYHEL